MSRRAARRLITCVAAVLVGLLSCYTGVREYRSRQWRLSREAWLSRCTTELAATVEEGAAARVYTCELDYISVRWTPATYARDARRISLTLREQGVIDACLDWAGGWSQQRP